MDHVSPAVRAAKRLRLALDRVVEALLGARLEDLLSAEEQLAAALSGAGQVHEAASGDRLALEAEIVGARAAFEKCRQLGAVIRQTSDACLAAQGRGGEYTRAGSSILSAPCGAGVQARA